MNQILRIIEHVNIKDFIDIFVVSVIIYNILIIIRGTRAVQMMVGLLSILLLFWMSGQYELYSLHWILDNFFSSFFIIFVVLFQEPIRSALVSFGNTKWWARKGREELDMAIEEVVEAMGVLSKEKCGALVVFERQNGLLNWANTGSFLDCRVHSDILYSIFQTISPLHDGALIISQGRIRAAGCFLPLSKNVEIDRHLGTRHRAALGMTEVSDAVVVLVSEETGQMKLVFNGIFYTMSDQKTLRRQLKLLMASEALNATIELKEMAD